MGALNPAALNAALDQAETTSQHFVNAGKVPTRDNMPPRNNMPPPAPPSGKVVSLKAAMGLPINKGKTADQVRADIQAHGHQVGQ